MLRQASAVQLIWAVPCGQAAARGIRSRCSGWRFALGALPAPDPRQAASWGGCWGTYRLLPGADAPIWPRGANRSPQHPPAEQGRTSRTGTCSLPVLEHTRTQAHVSTLVKPAGGLITTRRHHQQPSARCLVVPSGGDQAWQAGPRYQQRGRRISKTPAWDSVVYSHKLQHSLHQAEAWPTWQPLKAPRARGAVEGSQQLHKTAPSLPPRSCCHTI